MILVRMVFQAKLGRSAEVLAGMKAMAPRLKAASSGAHRVRLLTDVSGKFDTVVQEIEYDNVDAFLRDMATMSSMPEMQDASESGFDLVEGGYKEYYTVEFEQ